MLSKLLAAALAATLLAALCAASAFASYPAPAVLTGDQGARDPSMLVQPGGYTVFGTSDVAFT